MIKMYQDLTRWYEQLKIRYPRPEPEYVEYIRYIRDRNQCQLCGCEAHSVHHILPFMVGLIMGRGHRVNAGYNLIALCHACHSYIHVNDDGYTHIDMILLALQGVTIHDDTWDQIMYDKAETNTLRVYGKGQGWYLHSY